MLFDDTVMENIRLDKRGATDAEVYAAAKAILKDAPIGKYKTMHDWIIVRSGVVLISSLIPTII